MRSGFRVGRSTIGVILALASSATARDEPLPPLNAEVVKFARESLGKKVGNGQCTGLAIEALREAGARAFPEDDGEGELAWGEFIERPADIRPGDVLQFRDAVFKSRRRIRQGGRDGVQTSTQTFPHHTALVEEARDGGRVLVILHQNTGPEDADESERQVVQRDTLRMADLQPDGGWIKVYRPVRED